ncbi:MAG TPA: deoxyribonuclease V [Candidatus Aquicultor sp.]|jgi:deoxyribonuclease V
MKALDLHPWQVTPTEAAEIQKRLRARIHIKPADITKVRYVAGADVSYSRGSNEIYAVAVVFSFPDLRLVEEHGAVKTTNFPYIPGFLTFREGPAVLAAFEQVETVPDVIIFDGQGIAHPRGFGIASHIGVLLETPSVGCAKSLLTGTYSEPSNDRGETSSLTKGDRQIGAVLRTRKDVAPVFVSIGNDIDLPSAVDVVLACAPCYRLPEPIRRAHNLSNGLRVRSAKNLG